MFSDVYRSVEEKIVPWLNENGFELVDMIVSKGKRKWLLRIFIDKPEGVTIDDCANVSRRIGTILDVEDPVPGSYILEVSSPGIERPLKKPGDFSRFSGLDATVQTFNPISGRKFFTGKIGETLQGSFKMIVDDQPVTIEFSNVRKANLKYTFSFTKTDRKQ
jgi:ribosome maturation factor RimP